MNLDNTTLEALESNLEELFDYDSIEYCRETETNISDYFTSNIEANEYWAFNTEDDEKLAKANAMLLEYAKKNYNYVPEKED